MTSLFYYFALRPKQLGDILDPPLHVLSSFLSGLQCRNHGALRAGAERELSGAHAHQVNEPTALLALLMQKQTGLLLQSRGPAEGKFDESYNQKEPKAEREHTLCSLTRFIDESPRAAGVINHTIKAGVYLDRSCDCRRCNTIKADSVRTSDLPY